MTFDGRARKRRQGDAPAFGANEQAAVFVHLHRAQLLALQLVLPQLFEVGVPYNHATILGAPKKTKPQMSKHRQGCPRHVSLQVPFSRAAVPRQTNLGAADNVPGAASHIRGHGKSGPGVTLHDTLQLTQ